MGPFTNRDLALLIARRGGIKTNELCHAADRSHDDRDNLSAMSKVFLVWGAIRVKNGLTVACARFVAPRIIFCVSRTLARCLVTNHASSTPQSLAVIFPM